MENKKILYDSKEMFPMGIKQIIHGIKYQAENPKTHEKVWVGNGEVIYDVSNPRHKPYFALQLKV